MARYTVEIDRMFSSKHFAETKTARSCHLVLHDVANCIIRENNFSASERVALRRRFDVLELKPPSDLGRYTSWQVVPVPGITVHVRAYKTNRR